jgi:hypothetical protein
MKSRKNVESELVRALQEYAAALEAFRQANDVVARAAAELGEAQDRLEQFGIYIQEKPARLPTQVPTQEQQELRAPAVGPTVYRAPNEAEVSRIRSESYGIAPSNVDPNDAASLAHSVSQTMSTLISRLGGKLTVGPQIPAQPVQTTSADNPHDRNKYGGPVEQRPLGGQQ